MEVRGAPFGLVLSMLDARDIPLICASARAICKDGKFGVYDPFGIRTVRIGRRIAY